MKTLQVSMRSWVAGALAGAAVTFAAASPSSAAIVFTEGGASGGANGVVSAYTGTVTYSMDFNGSETPLVVSNPAGSSVSYPTGPAPGAAPPFGDTTRYAGIGSTVSPQTAYLTFAPASYVGFYWGSVDAYNEVDILGPGGAVIASYSGTQALNPASGFQGAGGSVYVNFFSDTANITGLQFTNNGGSAAFEIDNITAGVPEPSTWAMMILGFLGLGTMAYRKRKVSMRFV